MEVYYFKRDRYEYYSGKLPTRRAFKQDYVKLPYKFTYNKKLSRNQNLERVFILLNDGADKPNPLSGKGSQIWLKQHNIGHTSMSIGDIIKVGDHYYIVSEIGFKRLW